ncbi:MAG: DegQ family serine endoprotease [bacterium]
MSTNKKFALAMVVVFSLGLFTSALITSNLNMTSAVQASSEPALVEVPAFGNTGLTPQQDDLISQLNGIFINAASKVKPSVVTIYSEKVIKTRRYRSPFDLFEEFFGQRRRSPRDYEEQEYVQHGMGSGVVIDSDGLILTNNHVIKDADDIRVKNTEGEVYEAEVLGTDAHTDLALLKIDASNLTAAQLGDSDKLAVGEWVLAVGNPFSEKLHHTVTKGIVSAKGRQDLQLATYEDFIQTDAPINPGNSGGALVNLRGEVVGINTAIVAPSGVFAGVGFAIPINMARRVMNDLQSKGRVVRGYLGIVPQEVDRDLAKALGLEKPEGAVISEVEEGSPADKAGLKPSDVILEIDGIKIKDDNQLKLVVADIPPGQKVTAVINRGGRQKSVSIVLGERESDVVSVPAALSESKGKLGLEVSNVTPETGRQYGYDEGSGVLITRVDATSEARRKDLREGDLIREVNRRRVTNVVEYYEVIKDLKEGDTVLFLAQRGRNSFFRALEVKEG